MIKKNLLEEHPHIAKQWHTTKNGDLKPEMFSSGSSEIVWWICKKNKTHIFQQKILYQVKTNSCPICTGKKIIKSNSLAFLFPEISSEFHKTKNGDLNPENLSPGHKKKVWWQCPNNLEHVYPATIDQRTRGKTECPYCKNRKIGKSNSIVILNPELMDEWDFEQNIEIDPERLSPKSELRVNWICKINNEHKWKAIIKERAKGQPCFICNPPSKKPFSLPMVSVSNPELAKEWDFKKNTNLNPDSITAGSSEKVWWICNKCGHSWIATISNRARKGRGCPKCGQKGFISIENSVGFKYPDLLKEWDYEKNLKFDPYEVSYGSGKKVWWVCKNNPEHSWEARVRDRTKKNPSKCPKCKHTTGFLVEEFPEIAKEWHPTKNFPLTLHNLKSRSNEKAWWICSRNPSHVWKAEVKNRTILNSGCRVCNKEKSDVNATLTIINDIASSSKFYENYKNGIESLVKLLSIKIWDRNQNRTFRRMIYANIVTVMEAYLSDTFIKTILADNSLQRKFIETNPTFQKEKIEISKLFEYYENISKNINEVLLDVTFHNIPKVKNLYKNVLDIDLPDDLSEIQNIILFRHDLIHRNGKTKNGEIINVTLQDIKNAAQVINEFVAYIESQFLTKYGLNELSGATKT